MQGWLLRGKKKIVGNRLQQSPQQSPLLSVAANSLLIFRKWQGGWGDNANSFVFQILGFFFLRVPGMMDSSFLPVGGNWILLLVGEFFFLLEGIEFLQCQPRFFQCQNVGVQSGCQHYNNAHPFFCARLMCISTIPPPVKGKNNHCNDGAQCNLCATVTKMPSACLVCYVMPWRLQSQ